MEGSLFRWIVIIYVCVCMQIENKNVMRGTITDMGSNQMIYIVQGSVPVQLAGTILMQKKKKKEQQRLIGSTTKIERGWCTTHFHACLIYK